MARWEPEVVFGNSPVSGKIPGGHEASLLNSKKKVEEEVLEPAFKFNICSSCGESLPGGALSDVDNVKEKYRRYDEIIHKLFNWPGIENIAVNDEK